MGMDFEKNNVSAHWLKLAMKELYEKTCVTCVADLNRALVRGKREFLIDDSEEDKDRRQLSRLFELNEADGERVSQVEIALHYLCSIPRPHRLPIPPPLPDWPHIGPLGFKRQELLAYEPLVDITMFTGKSAQLATKASQLIDGAANRSNVPVPKTEPDLGGIIWPDAPELKLTELPQYEPLLPPKRKRPKIPPAMDPFPKPFLFIASFEEDAMPEFNLLPGGPKVSEPEPVRIDWLHPEETELRPPPMPPLLDHPLWPPIDLVDNMDAAKDDGTGKKKLKKKIVVRGLWEPEIYTQAGRMIPPLKERVRKMEVELDFDHDENCGIADETTSAKNRSEMLDELIPVIPVKSMARFAPKPQALEFPDFLLDIVRKDWANQDVFDVVEQRHGVLLNEMKREAEQAEEERRAAEADVQEHEDLSQQVGDASIVEPGEGAPPLVATLRQPVPGDGEGAGLVGAGTSQPGSKTPTGRPASGSRPPSGHAPQFADDVVPAGMERPSSAMRGLSAPIPPASAGGASALSDPRSALAQHQQRVREQITSTRDDRKIEQMLTDDRFVEMLAEKISDRLGIAQIPARDANFATGQHRIRGQSTGNTMTGHPMTGIVRPEPPSFLEPEDIASQATLPRALQGTTTQATTDGSAKTGKSDIIDNVTQSDVNSFTQEKARGEAYVRLLVKPEAHAAMKEIQEYKPQTSEPDPRLLMTQKYMTSMPKKPPKIGDDGEFYEEDDFEDVEPSNVVVFSFVRHNRYEAVEELIQQDPSVLNQLDDRQNNLLHIACQNNNRRVAKLLIKAGININKQNKNGNTALHYCYAYSFTQLAEFLIAKGADESLSNMDGKLPYEGLGKEETEQSGAAKHLQAIRATEM